MLKTIFLSTLLFFLTSTFIYSADNKIIDNKTEEININTNIKEQPIEAGSRWNIYNFNDSMNIYLSANIGSAFPIGNNKTKSTYLSTGMTIGLTFQRYFAVELGYNYQTTDYSSCYNCSDQVVDMSYSIKPYFLFRYPFKISKPITVAPYIGIGMNLSVIDSYDIIWHTSYYPYGPAIRQQYIKNRPTNVIVSPTAKLGVHAGIYWLLLGLYTEYTYAYTYKDISSMSINFELGVRF